MEHTISEHFLSRMFKSVFVAHRRLFSSFGKISFQTRYAEDVEEVEEDYQDPFGSSFGMGFDTRSFMKPKKAKKKSKQIEQRPLLDIPEVMLPEDAVPAVSMNPNMLGDFVNGGLAQPGLDGRSLGFRNPHMAGGISIAKGDARAPGNGYEDDEEPEMMSWHRRCQT